MPPNLTSFLRRNRSEEEDDNDSESIAPSVLSLPPYTVEPLTSLNNDRQLQIPASSSSRTPETELARASTLVGQLQGLHATLDRSRWPINPEYTQANNANSPNVTLHPPTPNQPASSLSTTPESGPERPALNSQASAESGSANPQQSADPPTDTLQHRSTLIMEALQAGEAIYALHNRTLFAGPGFRNDLSVQNRLQNVYLGELVLKVSDYIRKIRKSRSISDKSERVLFNRALQHCLKLQQKEQVLSVFYTNMVSIVSDMQNVLSKRHLELGIEDLVTGISDVDNRLALRHITQ